MIQVWCFYYGNNRGDLFGLRFKQFAQKQGEVFLEDAIKKQIWRESDEVSLKTM